MSYGEVLALLICRNYEVWQYPRSPALSFSLVKDTSLAATITVTEMFQKAQQITAVYYEPLLLYVEAAIFYLLMSSVLSYAQSRLEKYNNRYHAR
jgi:L-cystine transport system permease protein